MWLNTPPSGFAASSNGLHVNKLGIIAVTSSPYKKNLGTSDIELITYSTDKKISIYDLKVQEIALYVNGENHTLLTK
ncbi:hypothetical protein P4S64_21180 [Vibrio sp. M60_M31a]